MGMWGFGLYQNDMALDIQSEFEEMFKNGKSPQEIYTPNSSAKK